VDPYAVLGVDLFASEAEIVRAFRRLALLHHPDRNGGSRESAARFREIKAAYDELRNRRPKRDAPPAATRERYEYRPGESRSVDSREVTRVRERMQKLDRALEIALGEPNEHNVEAVVDAARWARLEVDSALAFKGHVADLRDEAWKRLTYTDRKSALEVFTRFRLMTEATWDLVALRNLRARLDGLLAVARGFGAH
jgi:curved DNA-binding protein CbpA